MDMQTVLISYFISALICAAVMASLWRQNRKHFDGLGFWLADYALQFVALPLVLMRGYLPDFVSMTIGNGLGVAGTLLLYIGLERFVGKRSRQFHNYVILAVFLVIHTWFISGDPNLMARKINVSAALIVLIAQSAWLMLRRVDAELRPITRGTGLIFLMSIAANLARIYVVLAVPSGEDFFGSNVYETVLLMTYQMLMIGLTFNLFAMVNRRLSMNLQDDIENRKRAEETLKQSEQLYRQMFLEHQPLRESHMSNRAKYMDDPRTRLMGAQRDLHAVRKDGVEMPVDVKLSPVRMETGMYVVAFMRDITERKQVEEELHATHETLQAQFNEITKLKEILQEQAIRDPLTNLHNRRYLNEMLGHEAARAKRENYPIGIMLIDIDHFKAFNDTYGHSAGDEVLRSLSHLLVDGIRQGDIACRYGGEEFLVVMIGAHETDVERRAETICRNFNKLQIRFEDQILSATVSIGVAFFPRHGVEIQQVIGTADAAMYQAKLAGRNRVQVWRTE